MKALLALLGTLPLSAQFITPPWQGTSNSEYAEWNKFTSANITPNSPDAAQDSPTNDATVTCTTTSAFLTSSGNIYSFSSPLSLELNDSANFAIANVLLQVNALGSELDLDTVRLVPADATGPDDILYPVQAFLLDQEALTGENGGLGSSYVIQWNLTESTLSDTYSILFESEESSMSLDKITLHTSDSFQAVTIPTATAQSAPTLEISGRNILVSWPIEGGEQLTLQTSTHLALPESWTDIATMPTTSDSHYQVSLPIESEPTFFRLHAQSSAQ